MRMMRPSAAVARVGGLSLSWQSPVVVLLSGRRLRYLTVLTLLLLAGWREVGAQQEGQDPTLLHGGSCLAMAGHDCVALVLDSRFGSGGASELVNVQARHVLTSPDHSFVVALQGLQGDVLTLQHELRRAMHQQQQQGGGNALGLVVPQSPERGAAVQPRSTMSPRSLAQWTSHLLYQRKHAPFYVEPLIVGLEKRIKKKKTSLDDADVEYRPYLGSMDLLGSLQEQPPSPPKEEEEEEDASAAAPAFCCMGAAAQSLYGTAQAFWKPHMDAAQLANVCTQAFLAALERDCLSGYGARLYVLSAVAQGNDDSSSAVPQWQVYDIVTRND